ncbi:MAG: hypothetical protein ACLTEX_01395 [Eggerthella lenta]
MCAVTLARGGRHHFDARIAIEAAAARGQALNPGNIGGLEATREVAAASAAASPSASA